MGKLCHYNLVTHYPYVPYIYPVQLESAECLPCRQHLQQRMCVYVYLSDR